jgi:molybdenum cofactor cytidylyltransferase
MITGIILASGFSKRMGQQKLMMKIGGKPMLQRVIEAAKASKLDEIILVYNDDVICNLGRSHGLKTVYNPNPSEGQSNSMKIGIRSANPLSNGYIFFVGDQPYLEPNVINSLIEEFRNGNKKIIVPRYSNEKGNPVVFHRDFRETLLNVPGDVGGRRIIEENSDQVKYIDFENSIFGKDIDTWEIYEEFRDLG